jgi:formate dehydrogenase major subunit/formate dehydrogenase alpha subunit
MALCVKGRYGYDYIHHPDRLIKPQVRRYLIDGTAKPDGKNRANEQGQPWEWISVDWETALSLTAKKIAATRLAKGADSVGVLTSAKCTNEENYLMNKFARQVVGTNNIDHCARL